jgi:hypothetical protein
MDATLQQRLLETRSRSGAGPARLPLGVVSRERCWSPAFAHTPSQGAARAELARSYGVSQSTISGLAAVLSRQARSAREGAEVNETWPLLSGIAADWRTIGP